MRKLNLPPRRLQRRRRSVSRQRLALLSFLPQSVTWLAAGVSAVVMVAIVVMSSIVVRTTDETVRRRRILAGSLLILGFLLATLGAVSLAIGWTAYGPANLWFGAVAVVAAFARLRDRSPTKPPPAAPPPGGPQ